MIEVEVGSLADLAVDALIRPVGSDLSPVSGASRAVEAAAGPELMSQLESLGELPVGGAVLTAGGDLAADFVIHVVIQSPLEPARPETVRAGLVNGLRRAEEFGLEAVAIPPLGSGAGGLDAEEAARIVCDVLLDPEANRDRPLRVVLVAGSAYERAAFEAALRPSGTP